MACILTSDRSRFVCMPRLTTNPITLLRELVAHPSVSPEGESGGTKPGEAAMAEFAANYLKSLGADVQVTDVEPDRPNVVAVFEPRVRAASTVALVPHLDTVGVAGMTVPPFALTQHGERLHGRGACDTKGPFAALLAALTHWRRSRASSHGNVRWVIAATMGEETGGIGARALVRAGFRADFAIALEPTDLRVIHANKGVLRIWIETTGRASHSSNPARGRNAIFPILPLLEKIKEDLIPQLSQCTHPLLGPATVNLGVLAGGHELNIIPEICRAGLDVRTHPDCSNATVLAQLKRLRDQAAPAAKIHVFREGNAYVTPREHPWAAILRPCGRGWGTAPWFCDANRFADAGIPAVAFGPGSIKQAHTNNEFITRAALLDGVTAFRRLLDQGAPLQHLARKE